jgi:hypothetical protein
MIDDVLHHPRPRESAFRQIWRNYHIEILLFLVAAAGLLLFFERSKARLAFDAFVRWLSQTVLQGADSLLAWLSRFSISNLLGLVLVAAASVVIVWRIRWRAMRNPQLTTLACPRCGRVIHRVRRHVWDRLLSCVVPVRRYHCASRECGWRGLRVVAPEGAPQPVSTEAARHH